MRKNGHHLSLFCILFAFMLFLLSYSAKKMRMRRFFHLVRILFMVFHGILGGKSSLGARLRTRKVRGRDASLPAPLLSAFEMMFSRGTVGALPQTPQGTLSLDPARGRRKGTKSPLAPLSRLSWSRFQAPSACSFLALRLSPCLLPKLSVKNPFHFQLYPSSIRSLLISLPLAFSNITSRSST